MFLMTGTAETLFIGEGVRDFATALGGQGYSVTGGSACSRVVLGHKEGTSIKYFCLFDTVDPRGSKERCPLHRWARISRLSSALAFLQVRVCRLTPP